MKILHDSLICIGLCLLTYITTATIYTHKEAKTVTVYTPSNIYYLSQDSLTSETGSTMLSADYNTLVDSLETLTVNAALEGTQH